MFWRNRDHQTLSIWVPPTVWAWRRYVTRSIIFWNSALRCKAFEFSHSDPYDIRAEKIEITEDFSAVNFVRNGETMASVETFWPEARKQRMFDRALGLCLGLTMTDDRRSVMCAVPEGEKYKLLSRERMDAFRAIRNTLSRP